MRTFVNLPDHWFCCMLIKTYKTWQIATKVEKGLSQEGFALQLKSQNRCYFNFIDIDIISVRDANFHSVLRMSKFYFWMCSWMGICNRTGCLQQLSSPWIFLNVNVIHAFMYVCMYVLIQSPLHYCLVLSISCWITYFSQLALFLYHVFFVNHWVQLGLLAWAWEMGF